MTAETKDSHVNGKGKTLGLVASKDTTKVSDASPKIVLAKPLPCATVFFIGGAGDRRAFVGSGSPNGNIVVVQDLFIEKIEGVPDLKKKLDNGRLRYFYLGYYDIFGDKNIQSNIIDKLRSKKDAIYIVGHSLGARNGAHITEDLEAKGYKPAMLITLEVLAKSPSRRVRARC